MMNLDHIGIIIFNLKKKNLFFDSFAKNQIKKYPIYKKISNNG